MVKRKKANTDRSTDKMEQMITVLQDLFILEGLKAGMNVEDIRKTLKINKWRVSNISKCMKQERSGGKRR